MKSKETSFKRLTFQGVINAQQEKLPEKSRSKSKTRSKASSISKNSLNITNRSIAEYHTNKVESKSSSKRQQEPISNRSASESIFRSGKRNAEQQIMKKIIKLKNQTIQIEANIKEAEGNRKYPQTFDNKQNRQDCSKLMEMLNFLEEFDAEIRKQTKQIGEFYLKQLDQIDTQSERKQFQIGQFRPLIVPHMTPAMPSLEAKLKQFQNLLSKVKQ